MITRAGRDHNAARRTARAEKKALAERDALAKNPDHLRLVISIAERMSVSVPPDVLSLDDLIGAGNLGLTIAARKFDPLDGAPFSAFARHKIRGAMLDALRAVWWDGSGGHALRPRLSSLTSPKDCEDDSGVDDGQRALAGLAHRPTAPLAIDRARRNRRVSDAIAWLPAAEREVLAAVYDGSGLEIAAAARLLGISRDRTTRLHRSAIASLRARLHPGSPIERELPKAA